MFVLDGSCTSEDGDGWSGGARNTKGGREDVGGGGCRRIC